MDALEGLDVTNILIYVGDAVRFDRSREKLVDLGRVRRTVASSLHTPTSFGSMLTGLYPPNTGMISFSHICPDSVTSIFSISEINASFSNTGDFNCDIANLFPDAETRSTQELEAPFVHVIRDPGGHAPYDGYTDSFEFEDETAEEYLSRHAGDLDTLKREYDCGVDTSLSRFRAVKERLETEFGAGNTLYIYTSDHGELLGEHGHLGHNYIATPELVYVPTTFVHPTIDPGTDAGLLRHVDLVPTILDLLNLESPADSATDGVSLLEETPTDGYNYFKTFFYNKPLINKFSLEVESVWGSDGGISRIGGRRLDSFVIYLSLLLTSHKGAYIRATGSYQKAFEALLPGTRTFGIPPMEPEDLDAYVRQLKSDQTFSGSELDSATRDRLEELGYI